jgi:O-methyltransferase involved in polyketide biosynthesis
MYLTREELFKTLRSIAELVLSGSALVFDYFDKDIFDPQKVDLQIKEEMARAEQAGEPMRTALDPATLEADLASVGFRLEEDLHQAEIEKRYSQGRKYAHIVRARVE